MTRRRFTAQHGAYNALQPLYCQRRMQARATQSPRSSPHVDARRALVAVIATCRRTQSTRLSSPHVGARRALICHRRMPARRALVAVIAVCRRSQSTRRGHRRMSTHTEHSSLSSPHVGTRKAVVAVIAPCRHSQSCRRCHRRMSTHTKLSSRSSPHTGAHLQIGHCPAQAQSAADAKNAAHS